MNRKVWATGLVLLLGSLGAAEAVRAADVDTARTTRRRPNAALLMRLARARHLSTKPRTFQTQVGVAVAARRHGDALEQQKRTLAILNNQYLRGTAAATPSESDVQQTVGILEQQLNAPDQPENAYEIRYYLAACHESLDDTDQARSMLQSLVADYGSSDDETAKSFVELAKADLERLGDTAQ
jgi:hypothetical protein